MTDKTYYLSSVSIVVVVAASVALISRVDDRASFGPEATEQALGCLAPAQLVKVPFRFHNRSSRPMRIVGATMTCKRSGCFGPEQNVSFPMTIPPGCDGILESEFKAGDPGIFSHPMTVFTDCEQAPKIVLSVSGQVVDPQVSVGL